MSLRDYAVRFGKRLLYLLLGYLAAALGTPAVFMIGWLVVTMASGDIPSLSIETGHFLGLILILAGLTIACIHLMQRLKARWPDVVSTPRSRNSAVTER